MLTVTVGGVAGVAKGGGGNDVIGVGDMLGPKTTAMAGTGGGCSGEDDESELDDVSCVAIAAGQITATTTTTADNLRI